MTLGYLGNLRSFIACHVCQEYVRQAWTRGITNLRVATAIVGIVCPLLIFTSAFKFQKLGDDGGELTLTQKLFVFYRAPLVKYVEHCASYIIFLLLYTYVLLFAFRWEIQPSEIVVYVWFATLILDEVRELVQQPGSSLFRKFRDYISSGWNKFDNIIYLTALTCCLLKMFPATFQISRILFAINSALLYVRLFRVYHANWSLGPKLLIFHRMVPELFVFMMLLLIFILAYGTASQALINPMRSLEQWSNLFDLVDGVVLLPYWQMYGELSLARIQVEANTTVCHGGGIGTTPVVCENLDVHYAVTLVLLAIYLIIANVMLLNLLIAIFTSVFEEVHENSKELWKWEMYGLVEEYDKKPGLAPPLVIIENLFKLLKGIWKLTCRSKRENLEAYMQKYLEALDLFERDCMVEYLAQQV